MRASQNHLQRTHASLFFSVIHSNTFLFQRALTDIDDRGSIAMRLMRKFSLGQGRVYCCEASDAAKVKRESIGHPEAAFNPKKKNDREKCCSRHAQGFC